MKGGENSSKGSSRAYVVHPDVKFKAHPFFSKLETITRPTALGVCVFVCVHVCFVCVHVCSFLCTQVL